MSYKDLIFTLFGGYEKLIDSNKDANGRGTLERYNMAFGDDVDTNIAPLIENLVPNTTGAETMLGRYIGLHEEARGVLPLSFTRGTANANGQILNRWMRRRLVLHIEKLTLIRGTKRCYELLLKLADRTITGVTITETFFENRYDAAQYDDVARYDTSICSECPEYSIYITAPGTVTPYFIQCLNSIIAFNQPIGVKLGAVYYNGVVVPLGGAIAPLTGGLNDIDGQLWDAEGQLFDAESV